VRFLNHKHSINRIKMAKIQYLLEFSLAQYALLCYNNKAIGIARECAR